MATPFMEARSAARPRFDDDVDLAITCAHIALWDSQPVAALDAILSALDADGEPDPSGMVARAYVIGMRAAADGVQAEADQRRRFGSVP
jgi:hypothetical protein